MWGSSHTKTKQHRIYAGVEYYVEFLCLVVLATLNVSAPDVFALLHTEMIERIRIKLLCR